MVPPLPHPAAVDLVAAAMVVGVATAPMLPQALFPSLSPSLVSEPATAMTAVSATTPSAGSVTARAEVSATAPAAGSAEVPATSSAELSVSEPPAVPIYRQRDIHVWFGVQWAEAGDTTVIPTVEIHKHHTSNCLRRFGTTSGRINYRILLLTKKWLGIVSRSVRMRNQPLYINRCIASGILEYNVAVININYYQ